MFELYFYCIVKDKMIRWNRFVKFFVVIVRLYVSVMGSKLIDIKFMKSYGKRWCYFCFSYKLEGKCFFDLKSFDDKIRSKFKLMFMLGIGSIYY